MKTSKSSTSTTLLRPTPKPASPSTMFSPTTIVPSTTEMACQIADKLVKSMDDNLEKGTSTKAATKREWQDAAKQLREFLKSRTNSDISIITDALSEIKADLSQLNKDNVELKNQIKDITEASTRESELLREEIRELKASLTSGTLRQQLHSRGPAQLTQSPATFAEAVNRQTKPRPAKQPKPQQNKAKSNKLETVRIQAKDKDKGLLDALKSFPLPNDVNISKSKTLSDGSRVLYTSKAEELKEHFIANEEVVIVSKPHFHPRIKVLNVPKETEAEIVQKALHANDSRLLRTIKAKDTAYCHLVFQVEPNDFKTVISKHAILPDWTACHVVECTDTPQCVHCLRHGHGKDNCHHKDENTTALCAKCGNSGHDAKGCQAPTPRCINCHRNNSTVTDHSAFDRACPISVSYAKWRKAHTDYGQ